MTIGATAPIEGGRDVIVEDPAAAERARKAAKEALEAIKRGAQRRTRTNDGTAVTLPSHQAA